MKFKGNVIFEDIVEPPVEVIGTGDRLDAAPTKALASEMGFTIPT